MMRRGHSKTSAKARRRAAHIFSVALFCCCLAAVTYAAPAAQTLAQYRQRVREVIVPLETLAGIYDQLSAIEQGHATATEEAWKSFTRRLAEAEAEAARAAQRLEQAEARVEWGGEILEVDNEWLKASLAEYQRSSSESSADNRTRAASVRAIVQRLRGLDERLAEADSPLAVEGRDKEAEKGRLAAILRRPEFNKEAARGGALSEMFNQFAQWVRDLMPEFKPWQPSASPWLSLASQIFILLLPVVVGFLVWRHRRKHGGQLKGISLKEARVVLGERLEPDQTASDLLADAERLARTGDLRGAIRKAYVALLVELGDRKVIRLAQHKTNRDYLQAVRNAAAPPQLYQQMQPLTLNFERHWYGFERADENDWDNFRQHCRQILNFKL